MKNIISLIALFFTLSVYSQNCEKNYIDQNLIEVIGKAEIEVVPDLIFIKILINEKDTKNKIPVTELEIQMAEKLKSIGINIDQDLKVKDLSSNFKSYLLSKNEIFLSKEYQLVVHDALTTSKVFLELEKAGISNISIERLDHSKIEEYRKDVKIKAIKAAKEKAEFLAQAISQSIGRALLIQEQQNSFSNNYVANNAVFYEYSKSGFSSAGELEVDFEKIKLEYSIKCVFELK